MIITCPACATRFVMDASLIPEKGRIVKCSACNHSWRQLPEVVAVSDIPPSVSALSSPPVSVGKATDSLANDDAYSVPSDKKHEKRYVVLGLSMMIGVLVFLAGIAYFMRDDIVTHFPETKRLYDVFRIVDPQAKITLVKPYLEKTYENGQVVLYIRGELMNTEGEAVILPKLKISLLNAAGRTVRSFEIDKFSVEKLAAGASTSFEAKVSDPPIEALDVNIEMINRQ